MAEDFHTYPAVRVGDQPPGWRQDGRHPHRPPYPQSEPWRHDHSVEDVASILGLPPEAVTPAVGQAISGLMGEVERLRWELDKAHHRELWLEEQIDHDSALPLLSRRSLVRHLDQLLAQLDQSKTAVALLLVRIPRIDVLRHEAGLEVAGQAAHLAARELVAAVRQSDLVAHLDGGDFAVVLTVTDEPGAKQKAAELRHLLGSIAVVHGDDSLKLEAQVGCHLPTSDQTAEQAILAADQALRVVTAWGG